MRLEFLSAGRHDVVSWRSIVSSTRGQLVRFLSGITLEGSFLPMVLEYFPDATVEREQSPRRKNQLMRMVE